MSDLKEGKESMKNEVFLALHNKGEDEAKERCAAVLHPVKIWHGRCGPRHGIHGTPSPPLYL